jgi:hypothetical protein
VFITLKSGDPPQVSIQGLTPKVNADDRVVLVGTAVAPTRKTLRLQWSAVGEPESVTAAVFGAAANLATAGIRRGVLLPGRSYTFRLTATDTDGVSASAEVTVRVNSPPSAGFVTATPATGTALDTEFSFSAEQWSDDVDDLPFTYSFAYVTSTAAVADAVAAVSVDGAETALATASASNKLPRRLLPAGTQTVVAYITDGRGATTRAFRAEDGGACVVAVAEFQVTSTGTSVASALSSRVDSLLGTALNYGDTSSLLGNMVVLSSVLAASTDLCASVECGDHGECFRGECLCAAGYSGDRCSTAPTPVHGHYSEWSQWSPCSTSCGGGVATRQRECVPPLFGGSPCSVLGASIETAACNSQACVVEVDGGWSEWGAWGECSNKVRLSIFLPHTRLRVGCAMTASRVMRHTHTCIHAHPQGTVRLVCRCSL